MATNTKKVKGLQIPFKEFMPGQLIISSQFNDDMKDIEDKVNEIIEEHNVMSEEIDTHTDNTENPHQVNAHQVGTYDSGEIDEFVNDLRNGEFNDNVIENNVLADDCIDTRNYRDASITSSKVEPSFGSQLDISENIEIKTRYTKQETDELIKTKVGDGTYTKEELDTKFEEVQAGVIIDSTIGLEKLKPNVGNELDISRNVNIRNKYTKDEVDHLIKTNALPRDWGSILEADIDESFQSKDTGVIPAADYMIADMFVSPTSTALEFDIKEVADSRNGYDSLNDRLNASDTKISSLELSVNDFKSEVETAFLNTLEKVDTLEEISGSLDTQIKGINKQIFDNTNEVDSKIKKINTQLKQVDTSINNANTQISALTEKDANHEINLNKLGSRIDTTSSQLQQVKSDVETLKTKPSVPVEIVQQVNKNTEDNKRQDIMLSGLFNENADGRLSTEENGNDIKLESSKQGLVEVEKVVGNTLVNRVSEPMRELTLNGDIDAEGTFVTTTEGAENGLVDVMCEGNTLVNVLNKLNYSNPSNNEDVNYSNVGKNFAQTTLVKPNTLYTIFYKIKSSKSFNCTSMMSMFRLDSGSISIPLTNTLYGFRGQLTNEYKQIVETFTTANNTAIIKCHSRNAYHDYKIDENILSIKDVVILEGDYTDKPIPNEYFEGMKSVGEQADGSHKIEIISKNVNENLFKNVSKFYDSGMNNVTYDKEKCTFTIDNPQAQKNIRFEKVISKDGIYTLSFKARSNSLCRFSIDLVDKGTTIIEIGDIEKEYVITFDTQGIIAYDPKVYHFIDFVALETTNNRIDIIDVKLEEGTIKTPFIQTSNKKEILLNEPLRGLPNGTKDKFVKIDGKNVVKRVLDEKTFNGSSDEGWIINPTQPTETGSTHISFRTSEIPDAYNNNGYAELLCDKFKWNTNFHTNGELIKWANHKTQNMLVIVIQKSQLTSPNVDGLKKWLQANPIKVVYQLAKPIYEPLEIAPELLCYNEVTHISNNSLIPSNMKVKNTGFSCRALTSDGTYTIIHNGGEGVTSKVDAVDNMVRLHGKGKKVSDVMVLDGEVSKTYGSFEGMKSLFEDKLVTQEMVDKGLEKAENLGKYKVDVKVVGKNLCSIAEYKTVIREYSTGYQGVDRIVERNIPVDPNKSYIISFNKYQEVNGYNLIPIVMYSSIPYNDSNSHNSVYIHCQKFKGKNFAHITIPNIGSGNTFIGSKLEFTNIQLEEGTVATPYEPYKEYKTSVYLNSPLLKGDEIVWKEDGLYHYHKMGKEVLDGSDDENWSINSIKTIAYLSPNPSIKNVGEIMCDKLSVRNIGDMYVDGKMGIGSASSENKFGIGTMGMSTSVEIKSWLSQNTINVVYELAEPYYEKISDDKLISEMPNNAILNIDSIIPCQNIKVSYTGNVPSVYGLEETGITNTNDIAATQTAVDFLLMSSMGEVMMSFKNNTKGGNNMGAYFASRIMKKALKYEDVIRKYPEFKEDIDFILRSEGYGDLIVEVQ